MDKDFNDFMATLSEEESVSEYDDTIRSIIDGLDEHPDRKSVIQAVTTCCIQISRHDLRKYHEWLTS